MKLSASVLLNTVAFRDYRVLTVGFRKRVDRSMSRRGVDTRTECRNKSWNKIPLGWALALSPSKALLTAAHPGNSARKMPGKIPRAYEPLIVGLDHLLLHFVYSFFGSRLRACGQQSTLKGRGYSRRGDFSAQDWLKTYVLAVNRFGRVTILLNHRTLEG